MDWHLVLEMIEVETGALIVGGIVAALVVLWAAFADLKDEDKP